MKRIDVALLGAIVFLLAAGVASLQQVRVTDQPTGATRACGSGFDVAVDRSGWEQWWVADLDDPDADVRAALLRTRSCPAAVNQRSVIAGALAAFGVASGAVHFASRRRVRGQGDRRSTSARRLIVLGRVTMIAGVTLVVGGLVATVVLVGDADAVAFRYVDRSVAFVGGLLLLAPALLLSAFGLAMSLLGQERDRERPDG